MKKRITIICLLLITSAKLIAAQESTTAISAFEKLVHSCDDAGSIIDSERKRLGPAFEKELLKFLGTDVEKHYAVACHLSKCCTNRDDSSLELLSLTIKQQALLLLRTKRDDHSLYTKVSLHIMSAVQSEQLGFHFLAIEHKSEAERLVTARPILKGGFPAMEKSEWELYDSLAQSAASPNRNAERQWPGFWQRFSQAIQKKDVASLNKMMPADFSDGGGGMTPAEWLQFINENERKGSWRDLQRSIARGTVKHRNWSSKGIPTRVTKDNGYYFEFRKDQWYFAGVVGD